MKNEKSFVFAVLCAFAASLLWLSAARAADNAGTVVAFKGDVNAVDTAGSSRELKKSSVINVGDTVRTGEGGYVVIEFIDGAKATVRPNSELKVDRYTYGTDDDGAVMNLVKGGLRAITGSIAHQRPDSYKVTTNVATLGVRGTEFSLRICEADCGEEARRFAGFSEGLEGQGYTVIQ